MDGVKDTELMASFHLGTIKPIPREDIPNVINFEMKVLKNVITNEFKDVVARKGIQAADIEILLIPENIRMKAGYFVEVHAGLVDRTKLDLPAKIQFRGQDYLIK